MNSEFLILSYWNPFSSTSSAKNAVKVNIFIIEQNRQMSPGIPSTKKNWNNSWKLTVTHQPTMIMKTTPNASDFAPLHYLISFSPCKWITLSVLMALISCSKDQAILNPDFNEDLPKETLGYHGVDEALWTYFDRFELEASTRGLTIDLRTEDVTGTISEIASKNVAGRCNYNQRLPNKVTIDIDFWTRSGDRSREFVVFHELGHCVLYRAHKEDANANNVCESIMRSGTGSCFDNYTRLTRESYLDELFDTNLQGDIFFVSHDL